MKIVRPKNLPEDKLTEVTRYLAEQWKRAVDARAGQVDGDYSRWDKAYRAEPAVDERTFPWKGASNIVVPLIRIHVDTMIARLLGMTFSMNPLLQAIGWPTEQADALEKYLNYKALYQWDIYIAGSEFLRGGIKNGTSVMKTPWVDLKTIDVIAAEDGDDYIEEDVQLYKGPRPEAIPFEDFFVYPITATREHQVQIKFHRLRFTVEQVKERCDSGAWLEEFETLKAKMKEPTDVKRTQEQNDANIVDSTTKELHVVECHFKYELEPGKTHDWIGLLLDDSDDLIDLYFNPIPRNANIFQDYRPWPRESVWYGDSLPLMLEAFQEECSGMHNDRRNNSTIANAPVFVSKSSSMIPNASQRTWYPGKIWRVDEQGDFSSMTVGRAHDDMLQQETFTMSLADRLSGMSEAAQQGLASGQSGKRGVYSATGTLALMSEGNGRQDTNVRDFRSCMSAVAKTCFMMQKNFEGSADPALEFFPPEDRQNIIAAMEYADNKRSHLCQFQVRTSSASINKETERMALMQMAGVLERYNSQLIQMGTQLLMPNLNPGLKAMYESVLDSNRVFAKRLLRAFDEMDPEGVIPNVKELLGGPQAGAPQGASGNNPVQRPGASESGETLSRTGLANFLQVPGAGPQNGGGRPT